MVLPLAIHPLSSSSTGVEAAVEDAALFGHDERYDGGGVVAMDAGVVSGVGAAAGVGVGAGAGAGAGEAAGADAAADVGAGAGAGAGAVGAVGADVADAGVDVVGAVDVATGDDDAGHAEDVVDDAERAEDAEQDAEGVERAKLELALAAGQVACAVQIHFH
ncbi:hypothetical protein APHAL10511_005729 [Amanita phalloides]|nr:hypothetical protein APHAL10511_005729 [Amanita phalloides]